MTDTLQNITLIQAELADGQPAGSITPQTIRDLAFSTLSVASGLTSTGTNQSTALVLSSFVNIVSTVGPGTGVVVPLGVRVIVQNRGAYTLAVYPASTGQFEALGTNIPFMLQAGQDAVFAFDPHNPTVGYITVDVPEFSPLQLKGPTSTAGYDALISVPDGGSENLQGTLQLSAACTQILGYDGSIQTRWVTVPNATDVLGLEGGVSGTGATVYSYNASSANSNLNLVAQGAGDINVASGSGVLLNVTSPALPVSNTISITPGTGNTNAGAAAVAVNAGSGQCGLTVLTTQFASGMAFGPGGAYAPSVTGGTNSFAFGQQASVSGGSGTFCFGTYTYAFGNNNFVIGYSARDNGRSNTLSWSSGNLSAFGDQQFILTQLRGSLTGNGSIRLTNTATQTSSVANTSNIANLPSASHARAGIYTLKLVVLKNYTDAAVFYADNILLLTIAGTISMISGSPTSLTAGPASTGATGITASIAADTTNQGLNVTVTVTGGLSTDVYCCNMTVFCTENGGLL